ncbi:major facilitator superfamily domain-containing protein [Plectosphaerella plurivora]|uniref:Major facilitator superfamily domain-containing protein n=1 Tax=Plectosphaerella plurivora TaxID=936078 RepID=A0A9P8VG77_9PEZI|nr:major facilitator superfamily domain-containing protein [Plectosphaerella plurivora]
MSSPGSTHISGEPEAPDDHHGRSSLTTSVPVPVTGDVDDDMIGPSALVGAVRRLRRDSGSTFSSTASDDADSEVTPPHSDAVEKPRTTATWADLPRKDQLLVITIARFSEPLFQTSLQAYMFYQLRWFDPSLSDAAISAQAGILHASFTAAQFLTALLWGRLADSPRVGRKTVILIGLGGTCVSSIGFAFSRTFTQALCFRLLGGITNGNVGVMRTMISEIIREKRFQSRAFLLLPMTFNVGVIVGPVLGGLLSDPAGSYPNLFGNVEFFKQYPYAAANLVNAVFLFLAVLAIWFGLEETLDSLRDRGPDLGFRVGSAIARFARVMYSRLRGTNHTRGYHALDGDHSDQHSLSDTADSAVGLSDYSPRASSEGSRKPHRGPRYTQRLPFRRIMTPNVIFTFISHFLLAFHLGTFNSLWFIFLSTPVYNPATAPPEHEPRLPFHFTGGLGLPPPLVGTAMAIIGVIGITLQIFLYPRISARLGTAASFRLFLVCFPIVYLLVPFLSVVPSSESAPPPGPKGGPLIWAAITGVLFLQVAGRTFALPGQTILVNNCTPHPSVLGTIHGLGQSVSSAARTIGPMLGGWLYGIGLTRGVVGGVWWGLSCVAVVALFASWFVREGNGHEIWLDGDDEEELEQEPLDEEGSRDRPLRA